MTRRACNLTAAAAAAKHGLLTLEPSGAAIIVLLFDLKNEVKK